MLVCPGARVGLTRFLYYQSGHVRLVRGEYNLGKPELEKLSSTQCYEPSDFAHPLLLVWVAML